MTVDFSGATDEGPFELALTATADSTSKTSVISFNVIQNDFSALALQLPADGAQSVDIGPWLHWNPAADADFYEIEVASSPSFDAASILASKTGVVIDSFKIPVLLAEGLVCYWRVRPVNGCGAGDWTEPFVFVTKVQNCALLAATDLPKNISSNGTPTIESKITAPASGAIISDVNVTQVAGDHAFMSDLEVRLISPAGTDILLFKNKCSGYGGLFDIGFDDSANGSFSCPPPQNGTVAKPTQLLNAFNGENAGGEWILRVKDNTIGSGGKISGFELEFCSSVALNAPFLVNNNTLQVAPGTNAVIGENLLKVDDPNNSAGQIVFTLITAPKYGELRNNGGTLQPGSQFTQNDINNSLLRYYDYGVNTGGDDFKFSATDGEGGLVSGTFNIQPFPVNTKEPHGNLAFDLAPNPASESVSLFVSQPFDSDSRVRLFNVAGQMLHSWTLPSGATMLRLDVAGLPRGVYAVSVENEKSRGVRKVIVQ
jgi:subtilisin-like proprotein convertase family protein